MQKRLQNIFFVCIIAVLLAFPLVTHSMGLLGFDFPEGSGIGASKSQLEGRKYVSFTPPTSENLEDGSFQSKFEKYVSDHVPFREKLLLFDAGRERAGIALTAGILGYPAYPTFYGSKYYADPEEGIVLEGSASIPDSLKKFDMWIDLINRTAGEHPEVKISTHYILQPKHDSMNPTYDLFGGDGLIDAEWVQNEIVDRQAPSVKSTIVRIGSIEHMKSHWFRSDHHWNLRASLDAYNDIAEIHGLQKKEWDPDLEVLFVDAWQGTAARSGRDYDFPDNLVDQADDFSNLSYYKLGEVKPGSEISAGTREPFLESVEQYGRDSDAAADLSDPKDVYTAAYSTYYGGENMEIINNGENNGRTCLFIGDSYSRCIYRYIAKNYAHTIYILPGNYGMPQRFGDYFEDFDIDDVIVAMHAEKCGVIYDESPNFFD